MDLVASPSADSAANHLSQRDLKRYVAKEMGPARKKKANAHLDQCKECRAYVGKLREMSRTFREFERLAIANAAMQTCHSFNQRGSNA